MRARTLSYTETHRRSLMGLRQGLSLKRDLNTDLRVMVSVARAEGPHHGRSRRSHYCFFGAGGRRTGYTRRSGSALAASTRLSSRA